MNDIKPADRPFTATEHLRACAALIEHGSERLRGESVAAVLDDALGVLGLPKLPKACAADDKSDDNAADSDVATGASVPPALAAVQMLQQQLRHPRHPMRQQGHDMLLRVLSRSINKLEWLERKQQQQTAAPGDGALSRQAAVAPRKPGSGFNEPRFMAAFNASLADQQPEAALSLLIEKLPNLAAAGINRKEKLKHLTFAGRRLQLAGLGKYGVGKMLFKAQIAVEMADKYGLPDKACFVDFGAGAHEPLALSTYLYGNGFERCIANDFLPIRSAEYAALSMYDIATYLLNFAEDTLALGQNAPEFRRRLQQLDLRAFLQEDLTGGFRKIEKSVNFLSCDILDSGIAPASVSFLVSFAVFEHVLQIDKVCAYLFEIVKPGGLLHHEIDLADHRAYRYDGVHSRFDFLTEEQAAPNLNRLRVSEQVAAFERAGFEVLCKDVTRMEVPAALHARFLPRYAAMSLEDQEGTSLSLTLRRPS